MTTNFKRAFLMGIAFGLVAATVGTADAWFRTVPANGNVAPVGGPGQTIGFPSDGTTGTPNGNSATSVFADFYIVGLTSGTQNVRMIACGQAFNGTTLSCGAPIINTYTANGAYDALVPKWSGTGSPWDYFTVLITNWAGTGTVYPTGIGVTGT